MYPAVVAQQLRCCAAKFEDAGSIPGYGGRISMYLVLGAH